jgi:putative hydrolase of the HAD superfamily
VEHVPHARPDERSPLRRIRPHGITAVRGAEGGRGQGSLRAASGSRRLRKAPSHGRSVGISCVFLDIGGVLLSDGWDHHARARAAQAFKLDPVELEKRHRLTFESFEEGKLTLSEYLDLVVFHEKRTFSRADFRQFMFAQSKPRAGMIDFVLQLKRRFGLKVAVVSNEGRELNAYRIRTFGLGRLADFFISSCYVHVRKPDADMFRLALDISQVPAHRVVYVDDTPMFVRIAEGLGIHGILHVNEASTRATLATPGLTTDGRGPA